MPDVSYSQLTPLEWLMPRGYVRQLLVFPSSDQAVISKLREGLEGVIKNVPYLLAGVVGSDSIQGSVCLTQSYQSLDDVFGWQDLSSSLNYLCLRKGNFPPQAFNIPDILPPETIPPFPIPAPVFRARLSLIKGGFILCVAVHHSTTDITGYGALLRLWASYCRTGSSVSSDFDRTWSDRKLLFDYLQHDTGPWPISMPKLLHPQQPTNDAPETDKATTRAKYKTGIFFFSQKSLQEVKRVINRSLAGFDPRSWVSTGDILAALLWCAVIEAEMAGTTGTAAHGFSTIGIPVNIRSKLNPPLPSGFLGAAFMMTTAEASLGDLLSFSAQDGQASDGTLPADSAAGLARIALAIRKSISAVDVAHMREVLEYLNSQTDVRSLVLGPRHDGISIVSWADQGVYELDWGETIGRCEAVRLPRPARKRYPIILPRVPGSRDGQSGLEVFVSLEEAAFARFQHSWPMSRLGELRCTS